MADLAAIGRSVGGLAVLRDWMGTWRQAMCPTLDSETMDGGHDCPTCFWSQETRAWATLATALPTQASLHCTGAGLDEAA